MVDLHKKTWRIKIVDNNVENVLPEMDCGPITAPDNAGWTTEFQTDEDGNVTYFRGDSKYATVLFGYFRGGHNGMRWKEPGGGGAITLLYSREPQTGDYLVGLLKEDRINLGAASTWCAVGGFLKPGETHEDGQAREAMGETGINTGGATKQQGLPIASNRNLQIADSTQDEGVKVFEHEIPFKLLASVGDGSYSLKEGVVFPDAKKQDDLRFWRWQDATYMSVDALALSAIARFAAGRL